MADARPETLLSDEELFARVRARPEVQARIDDLMRRVKSGELNGPGIRGEELADFLRELRH